MDLSQYLPKNLSFNVGSLTFAPSYLQAGAVVVLLFILILTLASVRRHFIEWSFKGAIFGVFIGFLLALILEGFLIIGGKTALTEVVGWKNAPQPILSALDAGRSKLVSVLGVTTDIPSSVAKAPMTANEVMKSFQSLNTSEAIKIKKMICAP